jgi:hypothetical protein
MDWKIDESGFDFRHSQDMFLFSIAVIPLWGLPSLLQNGQVEIKRQKREADHYLHLGQRYE